MDQVMFQYVSYPSKKKHLSDLDDPVNFNSMLNSIYLFIYLDLLRLNHLLMYIQLY